MKLFRLFTKTANPKIRGMLAGVMFRPISFKKLLGLEAQYPYGPYCTWKYGRNPIFSQVMGVPFRLMIKSGNVMVEAPNPLGVHPTSMSYVYKVFQYLDMPWIGIWVYPYTVTVTPVQGRGGF
jgi:hypothetical protein